MTSGGLLTFAPFPTMKEGWKMSKCSSPISSDIDWVLNMGWWKITLAYLDPWPIRSGDRPRHYPLPLPRLVEVGWISPVPRGILLITLDTFAKIWQLNKVRIRLLKPNYPVFRVNQQIIIMRSSTSISGDMGQNAGPFGHGLEITLPQLWT